MNWAILVFFKISVGTTFYVCVCNDIASEFFFNSLFSYFIIVSIFILSILYNQINVCEHCGQPE